MWKPGQLVTIHGKTYRITKLPENSSKKYGTCIFCEFRHLEGSTYPCNMCKQLISINCYLKRKYMLRDFKKTMHQLELTDEEMEELESM